MLYTEPLPPNPVTLQYAVYGVWLVPSNLMSDGRSVYSVYPLCNSKITQVFNDIWLSVNMVVASFSMMAEAVEVLHTKVQTLECQ